VLQENTLAHMGTAHTVDPSCIWLATSDTVLGNPCPAAVVQQVIEARHQPIRYDGAEGEPELNARGL